MSRTGVSYRRADAFFGLVDGVGLHLPVEDIRTIEVMLQEVTIRGLPLSSFLTEPLVSGDRTLTVGDLPLGVGLVSVEPGDDGLLIRQKDR